MVTECGRQSEPVGACVGRPDAADGTGSGYANDGINEQRCWVAVWSSGAKPSSCR
jgi:hypothetical protein